MTLKLLDENLYSTNYYYMLMYDVCLFLYCFNYNVLLKWKKMFFIEKIDLWNIIEHDISFMFHRSKQMDSFLV